jgi:hypothetical protein
MGRERPSQYLHNLKGIIGQPALKKPPIITPTYGGRSVILLPHECADRLRQAADVVMDLLGLRGLI